MAEISKFDTPKRGNFRIATGVLALIFGGFGVHKFILGYYKEGSIMLGISILGMLTSVFGIGIFICLSMNLLAIIEGLKYLFMSNDKFYQTYQKNRKGWL